MSDVIASAAPADVSPPAAANTEPMSVREAAQSLFKRRDQSSDTPSQPDRAERPAEPDPEIGREADAAPREEAPGENDQGNDPPKAEPIEPPRSWTKEAKEQWSKLPRETQEYLASREGDRDREVRRVQNEAAEIRKAAEAARQAAEAERQKYGQAVPQLVQQLQALQAGEFPDIKTWADAQRVAAEDPFRYSQWHARQSQIVAASQEHQQNLARQQQQMREGFNKWSGEQDRLFSEQAKEFSDAKQAGKAQTEVLTYLEKEVGVPAKAVLEMWDDPNGTIHIRDARVQRIIRDASKYNASLAAAKEVQAKPLPPVQRPGTASNSSRGPDIKALETKLERTGSAKDAAALLAAKRSARRA